MPLVTGKLECSVPGCFQAPGCCSFSFAVDTPTLTRVLTVRVRGWEVCRDSICACRCNSSQYFQGGCHSHSRSSGSFSGEMSSKVSGTLSSPLSRFRCSVPPGPYFHFPGVMRCFLVRRSALPVYVCISGIFWKTTLVFLLGRSAPFPCLYNSPLSLRDSFGKPACRTLALLLSLLLRPPACLQRFSVPSVNGFEHSFLFTVFHLEHFYL